MLITAGWRELNEGNTSQLDREKERDGERVRDTGWLADY